MAGRTKGLAEAGIPAFVQDYLETHYGVWFTARQLHNAVCLRWREDASWETVNRAIMRLRERGFIETAPHPTEVQLQLYGIRERTYWHDKELTA